LAFKIIQGNKNNNNNLTCKAPVCAKKGLQWCWRSLNSAPIERQCTTSY